MDFELVEFSACHVEAAVGLFQENYRAERRFAPILPERAAVDGKWIAERLVRCLGKPGAAALADGKLVGFLLTNAYFEFKGHRAAHVPEFAHAAAGDDPERLHRALYSRVAKTWMDEGACLHLLGFLYHDSPARTASYELGYGSLINERIRGLEPIPGADARGVEACADPERLVDLELEHRDFYRESPIFIARDRPDRADAIRDLSESMAEGDRHFVFEEDGEAVGCLSVGASTERGEGFLLRGTNSAQVKGVYVRPAWRKRAVGASLLQAALYWTRASGFERLFVEHETANNPGAAFWARHFEPFVAYAMRYADPAAGK
ncbi:MAG: GNAT family N-acetyltransferase [Spirochaetaceae bacterium]|nr:GNAT family N-acetyltransferase [Spirochaetaceae bacterium]